MGSHGDNLDANGSVVEGPRVAVGVPRHIAFSPPDFVHPTRLERQDSPAAMEDSSQAAELSKTITILFDGQRNIATIEGPA